LRSTCGGIAVGETSAATFQGRLNAADLVLEPGRASFAAQGSPSRCLFGAARGGDPSAGPRPATARRTDGWPPTRAHGEHRLAGRPTTSGGLRLPAQATADNSGPNDLVTDLNQVLGAELEAQGCPARRWIPAQTGNKLTSSRTDTTPSG